MKKKLIVFVFIAGFVFFLCVGRGNKIICDKSKNIVGGIIPHHQVAESIINEFFMQFSQEQIKKTNRVIVFGPNHFEKGPMCLSDFSNIKTKYGEIEVDKDYLTNVLIGTDIKIVQGIINNEHSILITAQYIKQYFPNAKIIPIVFRNKYSIGEVDKLTESIVKYIDSDTLIISSIDFSHYLSAEESLIKDQESIKAIRENDYSKIYSFNNSNLDSPPSLVALLKVMKVLRKENIKIINHNNSNQITNVFYLPNTSYFSLYFY